MLAVSEREILTVSELTQHIEQLLEDHLPTCWIQGEVSNLSHQASGHIYFSLKDKDNQVSAVLFRHDALRQQGITLRDGLHVLAYGKVALYPPRGVYQLIVRVVLEKGVGQFQEALERLKRRLAAEGLFATKKKKLLPLLPTRIGYITSATGAVLRDFISVLRRRDWQGQLIVLPARVQGEGASQDIIEQIKAAEHLNLDLLVIGRGGGSVEDLWAFNEEPLVRAVAACSIPTMSAVGHEIDITLCDFAADQRMETPTAAAEWIALDFIECRNRLDTAHKALRTLLAQRLERALSLLRVLQGRLNAFTPERTCEHYWLKLDDVANRLQHNLRARIYQNQQSWMTARSRLIASAPEHRLRIAYLKWRPLKKRYLYLFQSTLEASTDRLATLQKRLQAYGLQKTLARGFAVVKNSSGDFVTRKQGLCSGDRLNTQFADGSVEVAVTDLHQDST